MTCREFNNNITEYIAGRLPADLSVRMQAHAEMCGECSATEREERELRRQFRAMAPVRECRDLWPQLAAQLQPPAPRRYVPRVWAFGGAFAACATACMALLWISMAHPVTTGPLVPTKPNTIPPAAEQAIVARVSETRQMASAASDEILTRIDNSRDRERVILLGGADQ